MLVRRMRAFGIVAGVSHWDMGGTWSHGSKWLSSWRQSYISSRNQQQHIPLHPNTHNQSLNSRPKPPQLNPQPFRRTLHPPPHPAPSLRPGFPHRLRHPLRRADRRLPAHPRADQQSRGVRTRHRTGIRGHVRQSGREVTEGYCGGGGPGVRGRGERRWEAGGAGRAEGCFGRVDGLRRRGLRKEKE